MGGMGPAPKDPSQRARRNATPASTRLPFTRATPPDLPSDFEWHPMTQNWWKVWQTSAMSELMSEVDWMYMLDTALMHHQMWANGHWTLAAEVRLRVAAFGATPADRLRLRIQWADADKRDEDIPQMVPVPARERFGGLTVVDFGQGGVVDRGPGGDGGGNDS